MLKQKEQNEKKITQAEQKTMGYSLVYNHG